ncbi:unnamed protein product [Clonostachys rosea f. rosea IK726]|uniref:Uncharacterized protein n=1 Tax=Clonostachys rosea f. rosea IK726 TaxID=1349383 RepID=A0ACA9TCB2_BIOOC|nr:unnamed protein product [Clonostachys rosea f. rosea IK726]
MASNQKIAIVSVFDKTGLLDLTKGLVQQNVRILASGGTARMIRESGFPVDVPEAVEEIDIGGVTLIRAAAKNHKRVTILSDPADYAGFLKELEAGEISETSRNRYALKAFEHTADYDSAISDFFRKEYASDGDQYLALRYGANPHQKPAAAFTAEGKLPFKVLGGAPGYINLLDALNAWPLVKELKQALGLPAAASFKHVSPAGAAIGTPLSEDEKKVYFVNDIEGIDSSPLAQAYARARGADRMSSFGDMIALSDVVDVATASIISKEAAARDLTVATITLKYTQSNSVCYAINGQVIGLGAGQHIISKEVSDGVIAPGYDDAALEILKKKKGGRYLVLQIDPEYNPSGTETRTVYGISLQQHRNDYLVSPKSFAKRVLGLKWKKGTKRADKSNAIDLLVSGQLPRDGIEREGFEAVFEEVPAAFTSEEREAWMKQLKDVAVSSDAFNDGPVFDTAEKLGITFVEQNIRLFHH